MLRVQDATLRLADEKTILSASKKPTCAHRTRPYGAVSSTGKNGGSAARQELKFGHAKIVRLLPAIKGTYGRTRTCSSCSRSRAEEVLEEEVLEYAHAPQNTGVARNRPGARPKATSRPATGEGQHRMHGRPARGNDCGRARNAIQRGGRAPGRPPEGRCPPTFSPGLTSRLRARAHSCRGRRGGTCFCRCRCRSLQWPQGNWCCVAAPRPNLKSDQGSRAGPSRPWRRDEKPCDAGADKARRRPMLRAEDAEALLYL